MRLVSCHIEGFGKLNRKDIVFADGLTGVCEDNGYGKSTVAAFLKAMFYGMESTRKNGKFCDRVHFFPFDGGVFGGNVVFSYRGNTYKIERTFDKSSDTRDALSVYLDGVPFDGFDGGVGEKIFGIDRESFERTAFITDVDFGLSATDDISTKLNNFVEGGNDDTSLEAALGRIEKRIKEYKKQKLSAGLIQDESRRIGELKERISNCNSVRGGLPAKYEKLGRYGRDIDEINLAISAAQSENVVRANWENYDGILKDVAETERKISAVKESYPQGVPTEEDIEKFSADTAELKRLDALSQKRTFTDGDEERYAALAKGFADGVPTEEELIKRQNDIGRLQELKMKEDALRADSPTAEESKLCRAFSAGVPTEGELAELQNKLKRYGGSVAVGTPSSATSAHSSYKINVFIAVVAAAALIVGVILLFVQTAVGAAVVAFGAVALLADGFFYLNKRTGNAMRASGAQADGGEAVAARKEREKLASEIGAFVTRYGYVPSDALEYATAALISDCKRYKEVAARLERARRSLLENESEAARLEEELDCFFRRYGVSADGYIAGIAGLRADISDFITLKKRKENAEQDDDITRKRVAYIRSEIAAFCKKYGMAADGIEERVKGIIEDIRFLSAESRRLTERRAEADKLKKDKNLYERPESEAVDIAELNRRLTELQEDKGKLALEIAADEADVERGEELNGELEKSQERLEEYKRRYDILVRTADMLNAADRKLKDKYIRPVRDKFKAYSAVIERALGEKIVMDINFNVRFEYGGIERSEEHLSAGQKSVCALCFRLALLDNMYAEEKPFLVLDDPFVHLDALHLEKVKEVLQALGENMQILYFTCHPSRAID